MKQIYKEEELEIPWVDTRHERPQDPTADLEFDASREGVTVAVKARVITVTGPRGTLQKNLQHLNMSIRVLAPSDKAVTPVHKVKLVVWHGARKHVACLRTVRSIIENMVTGVRYGFAYKMRLVYAHFPINVIIADDKQSVEIRWVPLGCASSCSPADASELAAQQLPRREARPQRQDARGRHHLRVQGAEGRDHRRGQRRRHGVPVGRRHPRSGALRARVGGGLGARERGGAAPPGSRISLPRGCTDRFPFDSAS